MSEETPVPPAAPVPPPSSPPAFPESAGSGSWKGVLGGLLLTPVLHIVAMIAVGGAVNTHGGYESLGLILFLGVVQLPYMLPIILLARAGGATSLAKGLAIGAAITFLLNATCWMIATAN